MGINFLRFKSPVLFLIIISGMLWFSQNSFGGTINTRSCSQPDVQTAINSANPGDTVSVPACPSGEVWDSGVAIDKGIILKGAGIGQTVIIGNVGVDNFMVSYRPANPANDEPFVLTGFTFDANFDSLCLSLWNSDPTHPITKVRIHHNAWLNCIFEKPVDPHSVGFQVSGSSVWGVFDRNTITGEWVVHTDSNQGGNWDSVTLNHGSNKNFYFEDNDITCNHSAFGDNPECMTGSGWGGRYASRYNTFHYVNGLGLFPWFDVHGNQPSGVYASMGAEIYGNLLETTNFRDANGIRLAQIRAGKSMVFNNNIRATDASSGHRIGIVDFSLLEEFPDSISPTLHACAGSVGGSSCAADGENQHINNSYFWNNRYDNYQGTVRLLSPHLDIDCSNGVGGYGSFPECLYNGANEPAIKADVQYWLHNENFNGNSGIGCGTLLARPATCTVGVGYWATDQSCSSVSDRNVGKYPAVPISGTLYKCTSQNTWTAYYTPFTYPHPLRTDCLNYPTLCDRDTTPPAAPSGLSVN